MQSEYSLLRRFDAISHDRDACHKLLVRLEEILAGRRLRFMEVCGTHTVSIFQSGLRAILPENVVHISGPGCPVCVTHEVEMASILDLAAMENVILATFGDLLRVPAANGDSLKQMRARGKRVEIVYSPLDALQLAEKNPDKEIVFIGIGFETTAPGAAAAIVKASEGKICNFSVFSCHKLIPPAMMALLEEGGAKIDAFLLPGHVATVTGLAPFQFIVGQYGLPGVVAGFEPVDLLLGLCAMAELHSGRAPAIVNSYPRAVPANGNPRALQLLREVFHTDWALWRGLGKIPGSGFRIRDKYGAFDAARKFDLASPAVEPVRGCKCGDILKGLCQPPDCPMFGKQCVPANPVGPCMVSTEGSCAAWFKYGAGN